MPAQADKIQCTLSAAVIFVYAVCQREKNMFPANTIAKAVSTTEARSAFSQLIDAYTQVKTVREQEATKREFIRANRDVALARIKSQRDILELYLTKTFEERKTVIAGFFRELDAGIASGNDKVIAVAMQGIVSTVQTSPLQGVSEIMRQIDDPDVKSIEI